MTFAIQSFNWEMITINNFIDVMAFGAHPDDVEIGAGGFVAKECALGYKVAIVDLTKGEMGTRGNVEERMKESFNASQILNLTFRENLGFSDRHLEITDDYIGPIVKLMRIHRPSIVVAPYWIDRHPDHVKASELITEAHFSSGLRKYMPEIEPYRPPYLFYYFINKAENISFICDVSEYYDLKKASILAHDSQFEGKYPYSLESRDRYFGSQIKKLYGEGFASRNPIQISDPAGLWRNVR